ncbi:MAG: GGDEF domain-containing protein [Deltaproteobacteria bacterium]|nr:GGDEF domain-containing protein [Deltaproteobacteria bacterium]
MREYGMSGRMRIRWEFEDGPAPGLRQMQSSFEQEERASARDLGEILKIISENSLKTLFQPIICIDDGSVFGYESLTRTEGDNPFGGVEELFQRAIQTGCVCTLDTAAFTTALRTAHGSSFPEQQSLLFMNLCPETLMNNGLFLDTCDSLVEALGFSRERIVLEITEESMISNYAFFKQSLESYRARGYRIAIDDFGAGYGGLKMLSTIEPDFVKIDRHFISNIDKAIIKFNLVDAIATACHRIGISVVAEGVEREEELTLLRNTGIRYLQGFYLGVPGPEINGESLKTVLTGTGKKDSQQNGEPCFIGDIAVRVDPIRPDEQVITALRRFTDNPNLRALPVVDGHMVVGMLHRSRFMENHIIGRHGYGYSMNSYKTLADVMESNFMLCEANTTFDELSRRIQSRKTAMLYDDICVTRTGKYFGTVAISLLLNAITERNMILAKGCNPLSGLPGNDFIQREITRRLAQNMHFDVAYIDIDNFKPFNDHYGFERGDLVIRTLAAIITDVLQQHDVDLFNFAGHIGGDDFIVVTRPQVSLQAAEGIIARFEASLADFHGEEDLGRGIYTAKNRRGELENFPLLSLSIGIVSNEVNKIDSYPQLASRATEVKKTAKMQNGFSIARDRRLLG